MAVTPSGYPVWARATAFTDYGGSAAKRDFMGVGAVNSLTDVSAAQFSRLVSDVAAIARTAAFGELTFVCSDSSPAAPTVESALLMTGVRTSSYVSSSAPTGFPSGARNGNGDATFTFSANYSDDYSTSAALTIRGAHATAHATSGAHRNATVEISGQTVRVRVTDDAGSAVSDARVTLEVW